MDANLLKYEAFVRTAELGSFSKAAAELHYSQSGISRMVADLERDCQLQLLERKKGGVQLSADGTRLLPIARRMLLEYRSLQSEVGNINGLKSGLIRIGSFSSVAPEWLPRIIAAFQADYPGIDYEIILGDYGQIEQWLLEGRIDLGFCRLPAHPDLESSFIAQDKLMAVLPPEHPLAALPRFPLSALASEPRLMLEQGSRGEVDELLERAGVSAHVHLSSWDDHAILDMVRGGLGISILPSMILQRDAQGLAIRELDAPAYRNICIATRERKNASLALRRFLDYIDLR